MTSPTPRPLQEAPGPRHGWLLGAAPSMKRDPLATLTEAVGHGPAARLRFGSMPGFGLGLHALVLTDPEDIGRVLHHNQKNYIKAPTYGPLRIFLGDGLLTSEGETWRRHRRMVQPIFHQGNIERLVPTMTAAIEASLARLGQAASAGGVVDVAHEMSRLALDVACRCFFGVEAQGEHADSIEGALDVLLRYAVQRIGFPDFVDHLPLPPMRRAKRAISELNRVTGLLLEAGAAQDGSDDLAARLREARDEEGGAGLTPREVRDHALTFLTAGHETSANALAWTWSLLGRHPEIRAALDAEHETVLGGRVPGVADVPHLTLTRRVLEESMRIYPPAWIIERQALEDDVLGGFHFPAGSMAIMCTYLVHRNPELWVEPLRFDPDRFLPDRVAARSRFAYFPFGAGGRVCIGKEFAMTELVLALATLAPRIDFEAVNEAPPEIEPLVTLRPRGGLPMRVRLRS